MPKQIVVFIVAGLFLVGFAVVRSCRDASRQKTQRRLVLGVRLWSIADAPSGEQVRLMGRVRLLPQPLEAPVTGTACAAYVLDVEHRPPLGRKSRAVDPWFPAMHDRAARSFVLEDDSGSALVEVTDVSVELLTDLTDFLSRPHRDPHLFGLVSRHADTHLIRDHDLRYREWVLKEGARVAVVGRLVHRPRGETARGYRDADWQVVIEGTREEPAYVTDRPDLLT